MFAENTLRNLAAQGIDTTHVRAVPGQSSGVAPIMVDPSGENAILIVKGANEALSPADVDAAAATLRAADLILLQLEVPLQTVLHSLRRAAEWGVRTILNPAPATALAAEALATPGLPGPSFLVPNETELALLSGMPTGTEAEIAAAAGALIARGTGAVVVTLGGRGARLVTPAGAGAGGAGGKDPGGGAEVRVVAIPPVAVRPVDTTGAGDAFIGAFAHHLAAGLGAEAALHMAARYAAHSVTGRGTQKSYADAGTFAAFCRTVPPPPSAAGAGGGPFPAA